MKLYYLPRVLLIALVFVLPFSKNITFPNEYSYVEGYFQPFVTPALYGFDIVLALLILAALVGIGIKGAKAICWKNKVIAVALVCVFFVLSMLFARSVDIALYYWVSFVLLGILYCIAQYYLKEKKWRDYFAYSYLAALIPQLLLGIMQVVSNSSVGLGLFGESILGPDVSGVAKVIIEGERYIRPYGTMPHPNVFAIYMFVGFVIGTAGAVYFQTKTQRTVYTLLGVMGVIGMIFSLSRSVWLVAAVFIFVLCMRRVLVVRSVHQLWRRKRHYLYALLIPIVVTVCSVVAWRFFSYDYSGSVAIRHEYLLQAVAIIRDNPFGVGLGNYTLFAAELLGGREAWYIQPVHNMYALVLSEVGWVFFVPLLAIFVLIGRRLYAAGNNFAFAFYVSMVVLFFFDHAPWDLRQVSIMLLLCSAYVISAQNVVE